MNTCPTCKKDITTGKTGGIGRVWFCIECYEKHSRKRLSRMDRDLIGPPFLTKRAKEMKAAVEERDRVIRDRDEEKKKVRAEVRREVIEEVRRMSFWRRLKLLFNPFEWSQ